MQQISANQKLLYNSIPLLAIRVFSLLILLGGLTVGTISLEAQEEEQNSDQTYYPTTVLEKYAQIYLPPVSYVPPPVIVGPTVTTYYNPPVWVNNYPPVVVPGPVIVRSPWRPFLRTFIP